MASPFEITRDSSVWFNRSSMKTAFNSDSTLYTGTVRFVNNDIDSGEQRYMVEIQYRGGIIPVACRLMSRFGGAFNYEDTVFRGYPYIPTLQTVTKTKAGDCVVIGLLGGQGREGVILGGLTHPARPTPLVCTNGPEYKAEFNGIETYINAAGEQTITFKGQPTNISVLNQDPGGNPFATPTYDTTVGGGYTKWDKTGSYTISDAASSDPQSLFIDKANNVVTLTAGTISLKLDKANKFATINSPDIRLGSDSVTEAAVLGTTYRDKEGNMNSTLFDQMKTVGMQLLAAGGDPMLANMCPAAAAGLLQAAAAATAMSIAIKQFEATASSYLSKVVKVG